jgi:hypothetical protein
VPQCIRREVGPDPASESTLTDSETTQGEGASLVDLLEEENEKKDECRGQP